MPQPFDAVRPRLEQQYADAVYEPATGLSKDELQSEFESHCRDNPDEPRILTKARLLNLICRKARIAAEPDDYFVGKVEHHNLLIELKNTWYGEETHQEFANEPPYISGAFSAQLDCSSHICPDWRSLLSLGVAGVRDRAAARSNESDYHKAVAMVFDGVVTLIKRFNELQPSPVLEALSQRAPETFYEALQLTYIYHELIELDGIEVRSMGLFDALFNPFYLNDLNAGRLTREQAKELLKYFWIKFFAKTMGKRFGKPFTFGPVPNELTTLSFEAYHEMRIVDPKFHIRLSPQATDDFLDMAAACVLDGCTSMVFVNNDAQIAMLEQNGKTREDAENYILIGCYEPAVMGEELNCSGACAVNLAKPVEQLLSRGDYETFADVLNAYMNALDENIAVTMDRVRRWEKHWPMINPSPLFSGPMETCFQSGRDVSQAGAKYNTSGMCCAALANAVDSLAVIKKLVYDEPCCTLDALRDALAADWRGHDELRMTAMQRVPKWGNNDAYVDEIAVSITDYLGERINHEPNARGGVFQAALYGIIGAVKNFGHYTGALPDGRLAGEPLTMNTDASPGMDKDGVTSLINSVTRVDLSRFPNGTVLDIMLHPSVVRDDDGAAVILSIIRSYFAQGGMAIQFNIFDAAILRDAQKHPEKYANLQVRVCGWNVRFADLAPDEQDIFIAKAEVT